MLLKYPKGLNHTPTNCKLFDFRTTYSKPLFTFSSGFSLQELSSLCFSPTSLHVCLAGLSLHVSALPLSRHTFFWVTRFFLALDMHGRSTFLMLTRTLPSRATTVVLPLVVLSLSPAQWVIPPLRRLRTHAPDYFLPQTLLLTLGLAGQHGWFGAHLRTNASRKVPAQHKQSQAPLVDQTTVRA